MERIGEVGRGLMAGPLGAAMAPLVSGHHFKYAVALLAGFAIALALTPVVRRVASAVGMMDEPGVRRIHDRPIARGGGVAVILAFHLCYLLVLGCGWIVFARHLDAGWWRQFLVASLLLGGVGLVDDYRGIRPFTKLAGQLAAALIMFAGGFRFGAVAGFALPMPLDLAITVFWFMALTNAFNLIDGLDGLAAGLALITAAGLAASFLFRGLSGDAMVALILVGVCAGFLRYNFHPASIFLGDTGSMFLGFTLAAFTVATSSKGTFMAVFGVPLLAMGVPIFDTMLAIWRRSLRMVIPWAFPERDPPRGVMTADTEHLHHRFLKRGRNQSQVALMLYLVNAGLVGVALFTMLYSHQAMGIAILAFVAGAYVVIRHLAKVELWDTGRAIIYGIRRPARRQIASVSYVVYDVILLTLALAAALQLTGYEGPEMTHRHLFLQLVPYWVSPVFLCLAVARVYQRVWSRAQMLDFLVLTIAIGAGGIISLGLSIILEDGIDRHLVTRTVVFIALAHILLTGIRASWRIVRDVMARLYHSDSYHPAQDAQRVLLFGAGGRCNLFLRELGFDVLEPADSRRARRVIGLIDDDVNLRRRRLYGHPVLGDRGDLERLIPELGIDAILITAKIDESVRDELRAIAAATGITLTEWMFREAPLCSPAASTAAADKPNPRPPAEAYAAIGREGRPAEDEPS